MGVSMASLPRAGCGVVCKFTGALVGARTRLPETMSDDQLCGCVCMCCCKGIAALPQACGHGSAVMPMLCNTASARPSKPSGATNP